MGFTNILQYLSKRFRLDPRIKTKKREVDKLQNSLFRRSLVCGIILLLIGLSVTSSISGYQSTNDDYILAYWEFDEGFGNTAYDSSGHDYDGTIHGATWTTGHSGYALDYDGVNDYVDLDAHSENLGFNKTDDLIFSVYFKTTSTDSGCIYSMSHHLVGNYPEVHIELNSDGNIKVQVWVGACGHTTISEDTYNDDSWHHAEIFYNGITSNPTVKIYVDDELDISNTEWVCSFSADEFERAKIGSQSRDAIDYFDGAIDKLKIIKYPGGNQQNPPIISGPMEGEPGFEYDFTFVTNDPEGDDIQLYIDWDDGTFEEYDEWYESGEEVVFSHIWDDDDKYEIRAESKDIWHDSISSIYVVKIGNQPPEPPTIGGQRYGDPQQQLTYTFVAGDEEEDDVKYFIDWDDGTTDETNYVQSNTSVQLSHSWETEDDYNITAKAYDIHGKPGDLSVYHVRIGDQPPNMPKIYGAVQGTPGIEYEYGFISFDPENDNITYDIDWGDGNIETDIGPFPSGEIFPRSHSWNETGTYIIKARAKDKFDYYGDWSEHEVSVPRNKAFNFNLLELLFERFPLAFLTFKCLLGLLKYDIILLENL